MGYVALFFSQLSREILLHRRQPRLLLNSCLFFLMIVTFFPLTMSPDRALLHTMAPGIIWIALLLAFFLSSEWLFQQDYDDGVIEQWMTSGYPLSLLVSAKISTHWVATIVPFLFFSPFMAILFKLSAHETLFLMISLLCGTPALLGICALAAAFGTGLQQKGMLMALILLPLTIPVMMFGSGMLDAAMSGLPLNGYIALLLAMSVAAFGLLPFTIAGVMRVGLSG